MSISTGWVFWYKSYPDKGTTLERTFRKAAGPHLIGLGDRGWIRKSADYVKTAELPKVGRDTQ